MNLPTFIVSLAGLGLTQAAGLVRIPIAILGRWVKGSQQFSITLADLADIVKNFRNQAPAETLIDYEHSSEFPEVTRGGPVPAAGWLKDIDDGPDGAGILFGKAEFTPRARKMIEGGEYKYLSPAIEWAERNATRGAQRGARLRSLALVNRPFLEALPAIRLSETGWASAQGKDQSMPDRNVFNDLGKLEQFLRQESLNKMKGRTDLDYGQALRLVAAENPALITLRESLREDPRHQTRFFQLAKGRLVEIEHDIDKKVRHAMKENPALDYGGSLRRLVASEQALFREREQLRSFLG